MGDDYGYAADRAAQAGHQPAPLVRTHLVDADGELLCPEAEYRDSLTDGEFWDHVLQPDEGRDYEPDLPDEWEVIEDGIENRLADPCPECGQVGACAYDAEGRAMIHVTEDSDRG